jgi:uncharacterized protein (DUF2249 family)
MVLDTRRFRPEETIFRVMTAFEAIPQHCSFVVVTDQDPASMKMQFEGELKDRFVWEAILEGPREWKFMITKTVPHRLN